MTNSTSNEKKVQNLSQEQAIVILALMDNADDVAGGGFGFIQEASCYQTALNKHQFVGHLAHLGSFMGMCYDCSKDFDLDTNDMQFTLQDWIWEFRAEIEKKAEPQAEEPQAEEPQEEAQIDHHCIIQKSSDVILIVAETAQEAVNEYNSTYNEDMTTSDFSSSFHGNDDMILVPCSKFLHDKALTGEDVNYFHNGFEVDAYIETVEDFDTADTCLSSEYDEGSPENTYLNTSSVSINYFNLKESLLENALNYGEPLTYQDVSDIALELKHHFEDELTQDFDQVKYIMCTNSNESQAGEIHFDEYRDQEFYTLTFSRSNLVLVLGK